MISSLLDICEISLFPFARIFDLSVLTTSVENDVIGKICLCHNAHAYILRSNFNDSIGGARETAATTNGKSSPDIRHEVQARSW